VATAKAKYDGALDELAKLVEKRKQQNDKKVLAAYHAGNKTADEIIAFIESNDPERVEG
jgi:soluble lytic murein transglycosylase-like protein